MTLKRRLALAAALLAVLVAVISSVSLVGREARLVDVIVLFFSGFGGGASIVASIRPARQPEQN
jgi:hypothetical protein